VFTKSIKKSEEMIINKTKGTVLCKTYEVANTTWKRTKGLMFRKALPKDHGLLMVFDPPSRPGIWMFGMRFPIDIIFLDSQKRVIKVVENARPLGLSWKTWRVYFPPEPVAFVLEIPSEKEKENRNKVGDEFDIYIKQSQARNVLRHTVTGVFF
jgi:uncharacterized membrane protein (UPF0127 family)